MMKLLTPPEFSTQLFAAATETHSPTSQLLINGSLIEVFIHGAILEAAVALENYYLVFMTDDVPYEDTLRITLLSKEFQIMDVAYLGAAYSTGSFKLVDMKGENKITFTFFGGTTWTITVFNKKQWLMPFFSEPKGVSRPLGFHHYFKISGKPLAAA